MQDLLEQFDPLSINNNNNKNNNNQLNINRTNNQKQKQTNNIRSSSNTIPLFSSSNYPIKTTTTTTSSSSTTTTSSASSSNQNHTQNQKWIIKPPSDTLSLNDQDPLGFLSTNNTQNNPNSSTHSSNNLKHKSSELFTQAQIRSKLRQEALAKHLAHEPFKPTIPFQPTAQDLQTPLINLMDQDTASCLNTIQNPPSPPTKTTITGTTITTTETATELTTPPTIDPTSTPPTPNSNTQSIKIPTELFRNRVNKNKQLEPNSQSMARPEPRVTRPLDEHKLAAALLEGFDEFVSASPNPSSSSLQTSTRNNKNFPIQSFNTNLNSLSPTNNDNNHLDSSRHSTPFSSFDGPEGVPNPIQFLGIHPQSQLVMDEELAEGIRLNLPNRLKISSEWRLIYSIDQDGSSLGTLYSKLNDITTGGEASGPNDSTRAGFILVLKDHLGRRFGGFVNEPFRPSKEYYGSGECFLWKAVEFGPDDFRIGVAIKAYTWTGINDYMILSDHDLLSIGGGDGKFGLWIDSNLLKGSSTKCPAFNNEILCSSSTSTSKTNFNENNNEEEDGSFDVIGLECWMVHA